MFPAEGIDVGCAQVEPRIVGPDSSGQFWELNSPLESRSLSLEDLLALTGYWAIQDIIDLLAVA